ncbi:SusC/RagA family TonB-linked outer membrane protein, partial [uncultured Duncaniella sp.]
TSYFGQLNYNFDHKYLLSATFRADGSSMFAHGHQWGYFPSVSAAWVLSEENFLKDAEWLNELKFRAAIGKAGNNNIDADMWRYLYTTKTEGGPAFGEVTPDGELWYGPADYLPNPELKWETTLTRNFAFDIALFNNRLRITPEYYWNTTSDLIYKADILSTVGYQWQYRNIGQVTNRGFELSVNGDILRGKDYVLSANFNLGANKMKVDKLNGDAMYLYDTHKRSKDGGYNYRLEVGGEVGLIYGFQYDGLYSVDEFNYNVANSKYEPKLDENGKQIPVNMDNIFKDSQSGKATLPGKPKFKDQNGDGIIDDDDRVVIGRTTPKLQGGFGLSGQYKNFDFTANFTYFLDFDVYNATSMYLSSSIDNENKFYNVLGKYTDRWRYADGAECYYGNYWILGAHEHYLAMNEGQTNWNPMDWNKDITASCFVEDGSFMRCTDITLGYTMPQNLINKAGMSKCRFYASVTNPFIITNYSGFDPEVDIQSGLTPSFDMNRYPRSRSYVLGINLSF